jgi:hypothetical protein
MRRMRPSRSVVAIQRSYLLAERIESDKTFEM